MVQQVKQGSHLLILTSGTAKIPTKTVSMQQSPSVTTSKRVETVASYPSTEATVRTTSSSSVTATERVIVPLGIPKGFALPFSVIAPAIFFSDPTDWSSQDVAFLESNDGFSNLVFILSDIPGSKLVQFTEEELIALSPENEAALDKLFATIGYYLKKDADENSDAKSGRPSLGVIVGASVGVAVLFFVAVAICVLVCRHSRSRDAM